MLFEFFIWWYGPGWKRAWRECFTWVKSVSQFFSLDILLKTLFSPWKRIVSPPGKSIDDKFRVMIDNLVSRVVGFIVRSIVLLTALVLIVFTAVAGLATAIFWPALPVLGVLLVIKGLIG